MFSSTRFLNPMKGTTFQDIVGSEKSKCSYLKPIATVIKQEKNIKTSVLF